MIDLDGSLGEGGGQILRSSLALSLLTAQPFRLRNVRARRAKPGLQPQHLTAVRAAAEVASAQTVGAKVGSGELEFTPGAVKSGDFRFDIGTAGATTLVLHTVYLPLGLQPSPSRLAFEGGTHNDHAPCFDFLDVTWRAWLAKIGLPLALRFERAGFYPKGGGRFTADIPGGAILRGFTLRDRPPLTRVRGFGAVAGGLPSHIITRMIDRATERLSAAGLTVDLRAEEWTGGPGAALALTLDETPVPTMFFGLGARGKRAEEVADEAVDQVLDFIHRDAPVDEHSADQLVLPLAFAQGPSEYRVGRVTQHLLSHIDVLQKFLPRVIVCEGAVGEPGTVRIEG